MKPDPFSPDIFRRLLLTSTLGKEIIFLNSVDSTNDWISSRLEDDGIENVVVIASEQTNGRGRRGRNWFHAKNGGLAISLACKITGDSDYPSVITLGAGVALSDAVKEAGGIVPELKYPNDLLLGGKKVAGILTELKNSGADKIAVIGVGVNVNTGEGSIPEELKDIATSLKIETGRRVSPEAVLAVFLNRLEDELCEFNGNGASGIIMRYRDRAGIVGRKVRVTGAGDSVEGSVIEISDNGALVIKTGSGDVRYIISGETRFID